MARADGSLRSLLARLSRIDVLVIDDWAMSSLSEPERRDFWEICEDRYQVRYTILTSQLPVARWHEQMGKLRGIIDLMRSCYGKNSQAAIRADEIAGAPACEPASVSHLSSTRTSCAVCQRASGSLAKHVRTT